MITSESKQESSNLPLIFLVIATLCCLLPFIGKAFNIDEPLFIWAAHQIQAHPLDFYGFQVNWYGSAASASEIIKNPPLASYYLAIAAAVGGWSELSLHLAFLVPALLAVIGTFYLAQELTQAPLLATLIALLTPVFLLSSATVMCDTMMLAGYVWAVVLWLRGMRSDSQGCLILAAFLVAVCSLTKYFGMSLIPLLAIYSLSARSGTRSRVLYLLIPVALLCAYQLATSSLYGRGLLLDAASYATSQKGHRWHDLLSNFLTGLSFTGGCLLPTLFFVPRLWGRRALITMALLIPLLTLILPQLEVAPRPKGASWGYFLQLALFITAAVQLCALACRDLWQRRTPDSLLLFLWLAGTFIFAAFVNWSVNGRSVLPMVPVAGILVARALGTAESAAAIPGYLRSWHMALPLVCAWLVSMAVMWADYSLADTSRQAAQVIAQNYGKTSRTLVFQGHWGFQYYMDQYGAVSLDLDKPLPLSRLIMAAPGNNTNVSPNILKSGFQLPILEFAPASFLTSMNKELGAGFYSSSKGALPYVLGRVPSEKYAIVVWE
jgi:4-amino-4-deoxy-L-arabinose transferase-like glycosyltransferase